MYFWASIISLQKHFQAPYLNQFTASYMLRLSLPLFTKIYSYKWGTNKIKFSREREWRPGRTNIWTTLNKLTKYLQFRWFPILWLERDSALCRGEVSYSRRRGRLSLFAQMVEWRLWPLPGLQNNLSLLFPFSGMIKNVMGTTIFLRVCLEVCSRKRSYGLFHLEISQYDATLTLKGVETVIGQEPASRHDGMMCHVWGIYLIWDDIVKPKTETHSRIIFTSHFKETTNFKLAWWSLSARWSHHSPLLPGLSGGHRKNASNVFPAK